MLSGLLYAAADLLVRFLPARVADGLGVWVARLAFVLRVPARSRLEENLARMTGSGSGREVQGMAREAFANFGLTFVDVLRLGHLSPARLAQAIEVHGAEHLRAARASGRGVILLSAHVGNWELGAAWLACGGPPLHLVARPHPSPWVERLYARRRRAWGVQVVPERPLWRAAARALRRHEWVALMADRVPQVRPGVRRTSACAWAAALSRRTGALVLPAVIVRLPDRRYAAYFESPRAPAEVGAEGFVEGVRHYLRLHARQWFAFEPLPEGLA